MTFKSSSLVIALVVASGALLAAEPNRLPKGMPTLTGKAVAHVTEGLESVWTIGLILEKETWDRIAPVVPFVNLPAVLEMRKEKVRPGVFEATVTLPMGPKVRPVLCRVVDIHGREVGRDQILQQLKTKQPVLISVSGRMPDACYRRLPTSAGLIVLLGPGDEEGAAGAPSTLSPPQTAVTRGCARKGDDSQHSNAPLD